MWSGCRLVAVDSMSSRLKPLREIDARQASALARVSESMLIRLSINASAERQNMELNAQTQLMELRNLLAYRLRALGAQVHAAEQAQRELADASAHEVTDRKDEATRQQLSDLGGAREQRDLDEMAQVEAALQRLDGGIYGDCADCGKPIPLQRLRVQPAALRCAPCQSASEQAVDRASSGTAPS